jgi:hypothetical protein
MRTLTCRTWTPIAPMKYFRNIRFGGQSAKLRGPHTRATVAARNPRRGYTYLASHGQRLLRRNKEMRAVRAGRRRDTRTVFGSPACESRMRGTWDVRMRNKRDPSEGCARQSSRTPVRGQNRLTEVTI